MNKADLTERIIDPSKIEKSDIPALKNLAEKYSFSPVFSLLLLSGLSQHDDFSFEEELSEHAYRIPDRIRLFNLTHDIQTRVESESDSVPSTIPEESSMPKEVAEEETSTERIEALEEPETNAISATEEADNKKTSEEEETPIFSLNAAESIEEAEPETSEENNNISSEEKEEVKFGFTPQEQESEEVAVQSRDNTDEVEETEAPTEVQEELPKDTLEVDMYAAAVSRSIEQEVSTEELVQTETQEEELEEEVQIEDVEDNSTRPLESISTEDTSEITEAENEVITSPQIEENQKEEENTSDEPHNFFAWLAAKKAENTASPKEEIKVQKVEKETTQEVENEVAQPTETKTAPEIEEATTENTPVEAPKSKVESIIEKFINEEPQISRPKKEFFSPSKVAKKSLDESSLPVSETLAQIFAAQGNYPKAIASYEQLMLKFPEKKSFFANQIKKLKQKLIK